ncbi:hypothetical protein ABZ770_30275 [Streptomyces sp. NPDC006654]|uniref:hypothetical protein n=1 Tax=Streptomyces sp. NPDC006654 TaxID=3156897 RepID=UPI00340F7497
MTTPRVTFSSSASTRLAGSLAPTGSLPSAMADRSRSASHAVRPPDGARPMSSWRKSEPTLVPGAGREILDPSDGDFVDLPMASIVAAGWWA